MIPPEINALILARIHMAHETLADVLRMADIGISERSVLNRAYYAMFYAVLALANFKQFPTKKHQSAIAFFDREFVHPCIFSQEMSAALHEALNLRLESDYSESSQISPEEIALVLQKAKSFVAAIDVYLQEQIRPTRGNL